MVFSWMPFLASRSQERPQADLYGFNWVDLIPPFTRPLRESDPESTIDLHALFAQVYERANYTRKL